MEPFWADMNCGSLVEVDTGDASAFDNAYSTWCFGGLWDLKPQLWFPPKNVKMKRVYKSDSLNSGEGKKQLKGD